MIQDLTLHQFREGLLDKGFTEEVILRLGSTAVELTPLFLYHLTHNFMKKTYREYVETGKFPISIDEI